jgi:hypothetical protein
VRAAVELDFGVGFVVGLAGSALRLRDCGRMFSPVVVDLSDL